MMEINMMEMVVHPLVKSRMENVVAQIILVSGVLQWMLPMLEQNTNENVKLSYQVEQQLTVR